MGLGEVIAGVLIDMGKAAVNAVRDAARKALPTTKASADGVKSDSRAAYDDLKRRVDASKKKP